MAQSPEEKMGDWGLLPRIAVVLAPMLAAFALYWYCASFESECKTKTQREEERKADENKTDERLYALFVSNESNGKAPAEKSVKSAASLNCSVPCQIVKNTTDDAVAFFTAFLVYVIYIQLLLMFGQEKWLRRSWKAAAFANAVALQSEKRAQETGRTIERAYVQMSHRARGVQNGGTAGRFYVSIAITNHGNTPARITRIYVTNRILARGENLPDVPDYSRKEPDELPVEAFLVRGSDFTYHYLFSMTPEDVASIDNGQKNLFVYGYVDYTDQFGRDFRGGYARHYEPRDRTNNLAFVPQPRYNYDHDRKDGEGKRWKT